LPQDTAFGLGVVRMSLNPEKSRIHSAAIWYDIHNESRFVTVQVGEWHVSIEDRRFEHFQWISRDVDSPRKNLHNVRHRLIHLEGTFALARILKIRGRRHELIARISSVVKNLPSHSQTRFQLCGKRSCSIGQIVSAAVSQFRGHLMTWIRYDDQR
jgi:hypothetical protein